MRNHLNENDYIKYCDKYKLRFQYIDEIEKLIIISPYDGYIPGYDKKFADAVFNIIENGYEKIVISLLESPTTRLAIQLVFIETMIKKRNNQIEIAVISEDDGHERIYQGIRNQNGFSNKNNRIHWFKSISSASNFFLNKI